MSSIEFLSHFLYSHPVWRKSGSWFCVLTSQMLRALLCDCWLAYQDCVMRDIFWNELFDVATSINQLIILSLGGKVHIVLFAWLKYDHLWKVRCLKGVVATGAAWHLFEDAGSPLVKSMCEKFKQGCVYIKEKNILTRVASDWYGNVASPCRWAWLRLRSCQRFAYINLTCYYWIP